MAEVTDSDYFPDETSDRWLIGADYVGVRLLDLYENVELDASSVGLKFTGRSGMSVGAAGCGLGSGSFDFVNGRLTNFDPMGPLGVCTPEDPDVAIASRRLFHHDPAVLVFEDRILLSNEQYELEMMTTGSGVRPVVDDRERFVGLESTVASIDPARVELAQSSYRSVTVTTPSCRINGVATTGDQKRFRSNNSITTDACQYAPESDRATQRFFDAGVTADRRGNTVTLANSQGILTLRLATAADPVIEVVAPTPPPLDTPPRPEQNESPVAGRVSEPWFTNRAGSTDPGGADVPLPEEWVARDAGVPFADVVGRGTISVATGAEPFENPSDLELVGDPLPIAVRLFTVVDGVVVESGNEVVATQYRFGSPDPNTWSRSVVWTFERAGTYHTATVGYPEFPEDSTFGSPESDRMAFLTGLDPVDLLADIRFFE